ncbi:hypothetical protein ABIA39_007809 [Nocardia sp. GAS34]|uniref:hypothetical protein n=1 Tax=unclassified Nocardia TaxID=2637762 RepID=UPI003D255587
MRAQPSSWTWSRAAASSVRLMNRSRWRAGSRSAWSAPTAYDLRPLWDTFHNRHPNWEIRPGITFRPLADAPRLHWALFWRTETEPIRALARIAAELGPLHQDLSIP